MGTKRITADGASGFTFRPSDPPSDKTLCQTQTTDMGCGDLSAGSAALNEVFLPG